MENNFRDKMSVLYTILTEDQSSGVVNKNMDNFNSKVNKLLNIDAELENLDKINTNGLE